MPNEVAAALDKLVRHKAAGADGILADFRKDVKILPGPASLMSIH